MGVDMTRDELPKCEEHKCECLRFREAWTSGSIYRPGDAVPCKGSSYVAIHWNQNDPPPSANWATVASRGADGPAGPVGPTGMPGPTGPAGTSGATDLYAYTAPQDATDINLGSGGQVIATLQVPAGTYLIMGSVGFVNQDTDDQSWGMQVLLDGNVVASASGRATGTGGGGFFITGDRISGSTSFLGSGTAAAADAITLRGSGYSIHVDPSNIVFLALKVGAIHN
jgi:hypothetical protein